VKNVPLQEKGLLWLTFKAGLALHGFETTRPPVQQLNNSYTGYTAHVLSKTRSISRDPLEQKRSYILPNTGNKDKILSWPYSIESLCYYTVSFLTFVTGYPPCLSS